VIGPAMGERVDFLMFTGSGRTGRTVARQAAERLIGCSLELGGKNPMIVLPDADLEKTVEGAVRGCFSAAGQICVSIERMFVMRHMDRFVGRFVERTRRCVWSGARLFGGNGFARLRAADESRGGPRRRRAGARRQGSRRRAPASRPRPLFYEPTSGRRAPGMKVYAEETFGPVVSIYPLPPRQSIEQANATRYGLSAASGRAIRTWRKACSKDPRRQRQRQRSLRRHLGIGDSPIGGMKESGLRARHGAEAF